MTLDGKRIAVLGGSSGIGLAVARAAARDGAAVAIASRQQARLDAALATLPAGSTGHALDLTDEAQVAALFAELGEVDHLVFTAGDALMTGPVAETDLVAAQAFFGVRYWGAFLAAKHAGGRIRPGGSIVLTSGTAAYRPQSGWALAASICAAMEGLTRALAVELAPIRINLIVPGLVKTPLWSGLPTQMRDNLYQQAAGRLPVGHAGEADEVARAYLYAMQQTYATGQTIVVDGGGVLV